MVRTHPLEKGRKRASQSFDPRTRNIILLKVAVASKSHVSISHERHIMSSAPDSTLAGAERIQAGAMEITDSAALGGSSSATQFVSAWTFDSNATSHNVVFLHGLGAMPISLSVQFSLDLTTVYPIAWPWGEATSGNPVSIWMDTRSITLSIYSGATLHGWWNGHTGTWTQTPTGYWRVIASL